MKAILALIVAPVTLGWAIPAPEASALDRRRLNPRRTEKVDNIVSSHVSLRRIAHQSLHLQHYWNHSSAGHLNERSNGIAADVNLTSTTGLTLVQNNSYIASVTIGRETLDLLVDTGSSDTWVIRKDSTCLRPDSRGHFRQASRAACRFGPAYNGTFQYGTVPDVAKYDMIYGDGSEVAGEVGYQDITIAGVTVTKQESVLVDTAAYLGDGLTSGMLGLAYPIVGRVYNTTVRALQRPGSPNHRKYDPIFTNMYKQGLVSPVFSVAMDKRNQSGYLAFGGLPPVDISADFASTPLRMVAAGGTAAYKTELSFYTIVPDGFVVGSRDTSNSTYVNPQWNASHYPDVKQSQFPVILDTGTTLTLLPQALVRAYAEQIPGGYRIEEASYWALCDAKLPKFGVIIGGKTFYFRDEDIMLQEVRNIALCQLGLVDLNPQGPYILGETFLNSVVSVFDVGKSEIRVYPRKY